MAIMIVIDPTRA